MSNSKSDASTPHYHCSFCNKNKQEVPKLIQGPPSIFICSECVRLCMDILKEAPDQGETVSENNFSLPTPREIHALFDEFVIGQDSTKRVLSVAAYNHYHRVEKLLKKQKPASLSLKEGVTDEKNHLPSIAVAQEKHTESHTDEDDTLIEKSNVLLIGNTGSGKTLLARILAQILTLPVVIIDTTTLTEAGYVGDDVENILQRLLQAANGDIALAQKGIVYLDEIDKLSRRGDNPSITRDVSGEGVQQCLLKLLEGTVASVPLQGNRKHPNQETVLIDTTNILFICGGTFSGLEKIIYERTERGGIGFSADVRGKNDQKSIADLLGRLETEDLVKYGLMPELIGRLPIISPLEELTETHLIRILKEPKNALIRQYQKLFKLNQVTLEFQEDALQAIAKKALARKTGARGLRAILENALLETMYDLPSLPEVTQVIVDADCIQKKTAPKLIYAEKNNIKQKASIKIAHNE